jgi:hypothetical protein
MMLWLLLSFPSAGEIYTVQLLICIRLTWFCGRRARRVLDGDADVLVASAIVATPVEVLRLNGGCSCDCKMIICCP